MIFERQMHNELCIFFSLPFHVLRNLIIFHWTIRVFFSVFFFLLITAVHVSSGIFSNRNLICLTIQFTCLYWINCWHFVRCDHWFSLIALPTDPTTDINKPQYGKQTRTKKAMYIKIASRCCCCSIYCNRHLSLQCFNDRFNNTVFFHGFMRDQKPDV